MERRGDGWSDPIHLDAPVNSSSDEWFPTIAADGTIYFGSSRDGGLGRTDIYRCRLIDGKFGPAENLGEAVNSKFDEFEPMIAPDQSFLIFMASGRPEGKGSGDLYVSLFRDGKWQPARNLGEPINSRAFEISPKLSPDGRWLFFTSSRGAFMGQGVNHTRTTQELTRALRGPGNGLGDIYQIDFSALGIDKQ
jgi:Tol biopolymer transport system component